jgi:hypothetical protein
MFLPKRKGSIFISTNSININQINSISTYLYKFEFENHLVTQEPPREDGSYCPLKNSLTQFSDKS